MEPSTQSKKRLVYAPASSSVIAEFSSTPWAAALFHEPTLHPIINESRFQKPSSTGHTFVSQTLATPSTIRAWQIFYKNPDAAGCPAEVWSLLSLGSGVNGHVDTSHGGFISLVHDEALGMAAEANKPEGMMTMTAYLKIDYKKPTRTPGVVLCRAWLEGREGRKLLVKGSLEDGEGNVYSYSEGLFIILNKLPGTKL